MIDDFIAFLGGRLLWKSLIMMKGMAFQAL
jgi:hypothetical protein